MNDKYICNVTGTLIKELTGCSFMFTIHLVARWVFCMKQSVQILCSYRENCFFLKKNKIFARQLFFVALNSFPFYKWTRTCIISNFFLFGRHFILVELLKLNNNSSCTMIRNSNHCHYMQETTAAALMLYSNAAQGWGNGEIWAFLWISLLTGFITGG